MLLFFFLMIRRPPRSTPFPTRRSSDLPVSIPILPIQTDPLIDIKVLDLLPGRVVAVTGVRWEAGGLTPTGYRDRKSTRLNSSHLVISYAVFCLKKKKKCHRDDIVTRAP